MVEQAALVVAIQQQQAQVEIVRQKPCGICGQTRGCGISIWVNCSAIKLPVSQSKTQYKPKSAIWCCWQLKMEPYFLAPCWLMDYHCCAYCLVRRWVNSGCRFLPTAMAMRFWGHCAPLRWHICGSKAACMALAIRASIMRV